MASPITAVWSMRRPPEIHRLSILLVDDYEPGVQATASALSAAGHDVQSALNYSDAIRTLDLWTPEVAVLDINMSSPDSLELAKALRRRQDTRDVYVVAFTSMQEQAVRIAAILAGFDAFCRKGAGVAPLLDLLRGCDGAGRDRL